MERSKDTSNILSIQHSPYFSKLERGRKESLGYFYPPYFGFIPKKVTTLDSYERMWAYNFWHEFWHIRNKAWCYLGSYELILNYIAEDLMKYALRQSVSQKKLSLENRYFKKAVDTANKLWLFHETSKVANEISPTYYLLNGETQEIVATSLYQDIFPTYFKKLKISFPEIKAFVQTQGDKLIKTLKSDDERIKRNVRGEHQEAYYLGKEIYDRTKQITQVDSVALLSMNIDISHSNLIMNTCDTLERLVEKNPARLDADYRLRKIINEWPDSVDREETERDRKDRKFLGNLLKIVSYPGLPVAVRKDHSKMKENLDSIVRSEQKRKKHKPILIEQPVLTFPTEAGDLFITEPLYKKTKRMEMIQRILSDSYSSELLFKLFGLRRYSDELLLAMRLSLNYLKSKVVNSRYDYCDLENLLKDNLEEKDIKLVFSHLTC